MESDSTSKNVIHLNNVYCVSFLYKVHLYLQKTFINRSLKNTGDQYYSLEIYFNCKTISHAFYHLLQEKANRPLTYN